MRLRRGLAAIVMTAVVAGAAIALTAACSLTTSTDGLSTGSVVLPLDASDATPSDGSPADQTSGSDVAVGVDAADGSAHAFPPEAQTWPGNGHGYALYLVPGGLTWDDARARAEKAGGHLVTLGSAEENAFVVAMAQGNTDAFNANTVGPWLGGYQDNPTPADEPAGKWRWVDDTPWSFTFWTTDQPDNSGNMEAYLDVYSPGGVIGWNDDIVMGNGDRVVSYIVEYE